MASLFSPTEVETPQQRHVTVTAETQQEVVLVAAFADPIAADYLTYLGRQGGAAGRLHLIELSQQSAQVPAQVSALILFLPTRLTQQARTALDNFVGSMAERGVRFVSIVSTFRAHLGDQDALDAEALVLERFALRSSEPEAQARDQTTSLACASGSELLALRTVVFRPGNVLGETSRTTANLRRFGFCAPLVPGRLCSCFVEANELFAAIESERGNPQPRRQRICTLLGPNRSWKVLLAQHRPNNLWQKSLTLVCALMAVSLTGQFAGLLLDLFARSWTRLRSWNVSSLNPQSLPELLALVNKYNYHFVKVVGYNNGVVHFGHRYPGKTVVSTVCCNRVVRAGTERIKADCGATLRKTLDVLAGSDQELYVIPNYSYVCLGTSFFVPIHGSTVDYSTVAETITRAILYDPIHDRLIIANRDEPAFRDHVYNLKSPVVLLRLYLRVKPKSRYFVNKQELENASSTDLLNALKDSRATNVEIRKSSAAGTKVQLSMYYKALEDTSSAVLELPRDSLGRLWDRLEENLITSYLMHALTRHLAWHVELFFTAEEFATFWESHRTLPLRKMQLRYIRRDGLPHSPFREHDCVSVDMFMFRWRRQQFEMYLKQTFAVIRSNPGKHSS